MTNVYTLSVSNQVRESLSAPQAMSGDKDVQFQSSDFEGEE
jgi:hypothetical protein